MVRNDAARPAGSLSSSASASAFNSWSIACAKSPRLVVDEADRAQRLRLARPVAGDFVFAKRLAKARQGVFLVQQVVGAASGGEQRPRAARVVADRLRQFRGGACGGAAFARVDGKRLVGAGEQRSRAAVCGDAASARSRVPGAAGVVGGSADADAGGSGSPPPRRRAQSHRATSTRQS